MQNQNDYYPGEWSPNSNPTEPRHEKPSKKKASTGIWLAILCVAVAVSILLTFTLTAAAQRKHYSDLLKKQQDELDRLQGSEKGDDDSYDGDFDKLDLLASLFQTYSYYAGDATEEELLDAVLKAYAEATGDLYAEYYTEAEYEALASQNVGDYEGIGVSVIQTVITVEGIDHPVFQVIAIYENAPAQDSGLMIGDYIYSIHDGKDFQSIAALGGYTSAITYVRGEAGTQARFKVFRQENEAYNVHEFSVTRAAFESQSVRYYKNENDPKVGVVHISSFDLTTPNQFKAAVNALKADGVEHFVFDVRNNPGGDLQSIKAVLTYFLQPGDLILSAIDRNGRVVTSYRAERMTLSGSYASCNVSREEIGMYADLDMVVLCNENTASAAEVFTATLRDYGMAEIVGETTFGKGIMQTTVPLSAYDSRYTGYVKMTTYAYVTKCGVTYHEIGIEPGVKIDLSDEAKQYNIYVLPQAKDNQLQAAFAEFE